jgi:hypothetical protein
MTKRFEATFDGRARDVDTEVGRVLGKAELVPITAAKLDDAGDRVLFDETVDDVGLVSGLE